MTKQDITAIIIVEIAGRPADHVKESLKNHVGQLKNYKDLEVISEKFSEPKSIENSKDMFSCFSEVELEIPSIARLIDIVFDFMPSSVEIIKPTELVLDINDANGFLNDLAGRLHKYDDIAKISRMQSQQILAKLQEVQKKQVSEEKKPEEKKGKKNKEKE